MDDNALESINRRLGQVEHLLNAVLEKQERSTDNVMELVRSCTERVEQQIMLLRESISDCDDGA